MGLGLPGVQHEAALEPHDRLKGGEVGSERSASESSWEAGYLLTDNEPDRTENAPLWPSVSASAANSVRQAPRGG